MKNSDIGLIGLGVMGQMLSLNLERNGFWVAGYDIDPHKRSEFLLKTASPVIQCQSYSTLLKNPIEF